MFDWIGGLISGVSGMLSTGGKAISDNVIANKQINAAADLAQQQMAYDQALTRAQWQRDDTAMSRAVADYKNAGLNPILAVGGKGFASSAPVTQDYGGMVAENMAKANAMRAGGFNNMAGFLQDALNAGMSMAKTKAEIEESESRTAYNSNLSSKVIAEAGRVAGLQPYEIENLMIRNKLLNQQYDAYENIGKTRDTVDLNLARAKLTGQEYENRFSNQTFDTRVKLFESQVPEEKEFKWDQIEDWVRLGMDAISLVTGIKFKKGVLDNMTYNTLSKQPRGAYFGR